ncbi:MAG TPA: hypothetical protein VFT16_00105 [Candidatus Saccharimonadales bacterium]|nr:hypothetical protein [Candidatus Saccharimonadales bacterium]
MIAHFIGSRSHILEEIDYYRIIVAALKQAGYEITYDWIEEAYKLASEKTIKRASETWREVDRQYEDAVQKADVVIVDATHRGFFVGYRTALAVAQKKPLLLLTREASDLAVSGINTPAGFVRSTAYDSNNLEAIVKEFLEENVIDTKDLRFNFFLDRPTYNYLRWMSSKTGKTKAEIVRSLLQKEMNKDND